MRTVWVQNFGCRAAQSDGAALESQFLNRGLAAASARCSADLVVLNTCTVTHQADQDVRQTIRRVHRENPGARILVTGCYAQRAPGELRDLPGVRWVVGNSHKHQIPDLIDSTPPAETGESAAPYHGQVVVGDIFSHTEFLSAPIQEAAGDRTRPNLKIQDGCNNRCSFCVIPFVRGRSRSASPGEVLEQVRELSRRYREIVLSGVNLGRWGRENGGAMRLADLVRQILNETAVERLRLSSVEPMDFSDDLLELMAASPRVANHVHAPLQSGSDRTLKRMFRKYRARHYENRIRFAHRLMPDAAFGADVMTGFPGETDEEFEESRAFIESLPFTYLHVFTYSARPGTKAEALPGQVPIPVRKYRNQVLRDLASRKNLEFRRRMVGNTLSAVTLDQSASALTTNYLKVELAAHRDPNQLTDLQIGGITRDGLAEATPFPIL